MIMIPGELIAFLTLPGIPLHELAHKLACNISGVKVLKVCYLDKNMRGYVIHEQPSNLWQSMSITLSPLIAGYGMTVVMGYVAMTFVELTWAYIIALWFAFSFAMHALPSDDDVNSLWAHTRGFVGVLHIGDTYYEVHRSSPLVIRIAIFPIVVIVKILNSLRVLWIDAIIAFMILGSILWFS